MPSESEAPAILGGTPVCPDGPPAWPFDWPDVRDAARQSLEDGSWGRYHGPHCAALRDALAEQHRSPTPRPAADGPAPSATPASATPATQSDADTRTDFTPPEPILCCSGTAAVELALRAARVDAGDEVILAAYDFRANLQNVLTLKATPVLVDVEPDGWQIDADRIGAAVTERTRAIIASHLHGGLVDMPHLMTVAAERNLFVIEDACQATGAVLQGRRAGTFGHAGILSFGGSKLLTAGRGGAVLANTPDCAQRIRLYAERGNSAYPLSELQAALLRPQITQIDKRNHRRFRNVKLLAELLNDVSGLSPVFDVDAPSHGNLPAFYKAGFQYDPSKFHGLPRDRFAQAVRAEGVALDPGFQAFPDTHSRRRYRASGDLTNALQAGRNMLVLHHPVLLGQESDIHAVARAIHRVARASREIAARE